LLCYKPCLPGYSEDTEWFVIPICRPFPEPNDFLQCPSGWVTDNTKPSTKSCQKPSDSITQKTGYNTFNDCRNNLWSRGYQCKQYAKQYWGDCPPGFHTGAYNQCIRDCPAGMWMKDEVEKCSFDRYYRDVGLPMKCKKG